MGPSEEIRSGESNRQPGAADPIVRSESLQNSSAANVVEVDHVSFAASEVDLARAETAGYWTQELLEQRLTKCLQVNPAAGISGMFTYPGTANPDWRLLRNISRVEAAFFAGGTETFLNKVGNLLTLGNPRIMHALYGKIMDLESPVFLKNWLIDKFINTMGIKPEALDGRDPHSFPSLQKLFLRDIDMSKRPLSADPLVSPVDGYLKGEGPITGGVIPQNIKGEHFTVAEFIHDEVEAQRYNGGHWHNLYLSPADYHHVHSALSGNVVKAEYIPGTLWPVNQWSHEHRHNLYGQQERLVLHIDSDQFGRMAFVMVGATTVGGMYLTFDETIKPPVWNKDRQETMVRVYDEPVRIEKGDRIGTFRLGSTVVMLFENGAVRSTLPQFDLDSNVLRVQVNETMGKNPDA